MILIDSSVWIEHLRRPIEQLTDLVRSGLVLQHPFVTGEIALGSIARRESVLAVLTSLPQLPTLSQSAILQFIEDADLMSKGVGLVDTHLLASAATAGARLWTNDKRLSEQADRLNLRATES